MNFSIFKFIKQQIFLLICCFSFISYSQAIRLSDQAQVSVLTCGSGNEMYSIFGHTAIRISDPSTGFDVVYNYGMFDFNTPNFYSKFIKGDLLYSIGIENYNEFLATYKYYNRSVNEQYLNLTTEQKQSILDQIETQITTKDRYYRYKFIENNCTTKVVDLLNNVLESPLETNFEGNEMSQRIILNSYLQNNYFEKLGINLLFSKVVDKDNTKVFLPEKLMHSISNTNKDEFELLQNDVLHFEKIKDKKDTNWNTIYFFSIICLILIFISRLKFIQFSLFVIFGLFGIVILTVSLYTSHNELVFNETLLILNPLYFLLFFKKIRKLTVKILVCLILIFLIVASFTKILIVLPLLILQVFLLIQFYKKI